MNRSPDKALHDTIRIFNDDLEEDNITEALDLADTSFFEAISEALNANEVISTSEGITFYKQSISALSSFVRGQKFDDRKECLDYIRQCDKCISDIQEEKKHAKGKRNKAYQFTLRYMFELTKDIVKTFVVPLALRKVKLPAKIAYLVGIFTSIKLPKAFKYIGAGLGILSEIPVITNLYLSFTDYYTLLDNYEKKIVRMKDYYEQQYKLAEESGKESDHKKNSEKEDKPTRKENPKMMNIKEAFEDPEAKVHYMTPKDLEIKNKEPEVPEVPVGPAVQKDVMHDDEHLSDVHVDPDVPMVDPVAPPATPEAPKFTPIDAISAARKLPQNVLITKMNGGYFVDMSDLDSFMKGSNCCSYEKALNDIIDAHHDSDMDASNVKVVLTRDRLASLPQEVCAKMEASQVEFAIF